MNINVDGQKGKGVGIFGGAMGLGAVFWTLVSLWLTTSASLATTLYCLGAIQFVMALPVAFMAPGWIFYGVAAAAGPIVAYCVSQNRVYCPVPLTVRGTQALVSFAPLAFKLFFAARQNAGKVVRLATKRETYSR